MRAPRALYRRQSAIIDGLQLEKDISFLPTVGNRPTGNESGIYNCHNYSKVIRHLCLMYNPKVMLSFFKFWYRPKLLNNHRSAKLYK